MTLAARIGGALGIAFGASVALAVTGSQLVPFWNYAIQVDPPIHVIVRHGRVTLTGVVISEVERRKAEVMARTVRHNRDLSP
jgi:hypothetical protein